MKVKVVIRFPFMEDGQLNEDELSCEIVRNFMVVPRIGEHVLLDEEDLPNVVHDVWHTAGEFPEVTIWIRITGNGPDDGTGTNRKWAEGWLASFADEDITGKELLEDI